MNNEPRKAKCLDNCQNTIALTIYKKYLIKGEIEEEYLIENDNGYENYYLKNRFEVVKEDKQVKEYSFEEVIANIKEGDTYKCTEKIWIVNTISKEEGSIKFNNGNGIHHGGINNKQLFIKVETPVSFMEALSSDKKCKVKSKIISKVYDKCCKGMDIRVGLIKNVLDGNSDYLNSIIFALSGYMGCSDWEEFIKNGEFYIDED